MPAAGSETIAIAMRFSFLFAGIFALAACHQNPEQAANNQSVAPVPAEGIKGVQRNFAGKPAPAVVFNDPTGKPVKLADFIGRPVLVNLWASWCAPCVKELPTLDHLAGTGRLEVIAVSQDSGPHASVVAFLREHRIATLKSYQDPNMGLSGALGPDTVLPTSILFDARGKEVWRYIGDQDWTSAEAAKLLSEAAASPKPD